MTSALSNETEKDVLPWLKLAEDLRVLNLDVELNMPQICVMGDQSSGKSSVLEALSGIPFPRGSGLVTRCPIRMVMKRARHNEPWSAVVSTTTNTSPTVARDIPELNALMDRKMQDLCGGAGNFSTESVVVELTSPDACDLTVVDLPGIIRTVTAGQSISSIEQVNRLIKNYLLDKRTIILAVIPANQDIATVDILERAQSVDPTGQRTIGVLTKVDLVGPGNEEEVLAVVNNIRKPLNLGYIMVKNRSQKEIIESISTSKARENEASFFANHPVFKKCSHNLRGVTQLSKKLTNLLVERIKQELGPMKLLVERMLTEVRGQLRLMPSNIKVVKSTSDRQKLLVSVTQEFVRHLNDCIRGEYRDRLMVRHSELRLYTLAMKKFVEFQHTINQTAPAFKQEEYIQALTKQIEQLRGRELPGFMSSQAFYMCMAQYVNFWEEPMEQLIKDVQVVAVQVADRLAELLLGHYPILQESLRNATEKVLIDASQTALIKLNEILSREKDPFTLNDFLQQWVNKLRFDRFAKAIEQSFEQARNPASNWNGLKEEIYSSMRTWYRETHAISALASAHEMSAIMEAYWNLSAKRFVDNCCMISDKEILGILPDAIQDQMYQYIKDEAKLQIIFTESPEIFRRKQELEERKDRLTQAASRLESITTQSSH